jgi:hypothetical protein
MAVTMPVADTVALPVTALQVPPAVVLAKVVLAPGQRVEVPTVIDPTPEDSTLTDK